MGYFGELYYPETKRIFVGEPIEDIKATAEALETKYNTAKQGADALDIMASTLDVRDVDYSIKKARIEAIRNGFKDFAEKGNWEDATYTLQKEYKDFTTDEGLNNAKNMKTKISADSAALLAKQADLGYSMDDINVFIKANEDSYTGQQFVDPLTGEKLDPVKDKDKGKWTYKYSPYTPSKVPDFTEKVNKVLTDWKANTTAYANSTIDYTTLRVLDKSGQVEEIGTQELRNYVKEYFATDQEIQNWFNDKKFLTENAPSRTYSELVSTLLPQLDTTSTYKPMYDTDTTTGETYISGIKEVIGYDTDATTKEQTPIYKETSFVKTDENGKLSIDKDNLYTAYKNIFTELQTNMGSNKYSYKKETADISTKDYGKGLAKYAYDLENPVPNITENDPEVTYTNAILSKDDDGETSIAKYIDSQDATYGELVSKFITGVGLTYTPNYWDIDKIKTLLKNATTDKNGNKFVGKLSYENAYKAYQVLSKITENKAIANQLKVDANNAAAKKLGWVDYKDYVRHKYQDKIQDKTGFSDIQYEQALELYDQYTNEWKTKGFKGTDNFRNKIGKDVYDKLFYPFYSAIANMKSTIEKDFTEAKDEYYTANKTKQIGTISTTAMPAGYTVGTDTDGNLILTKNEDPDAITKSTKMINDYFKDVRNLGGKTYSTTGNNNMSLEKVYKLIGYTPGVSKGEVVVGTPRLTKTNSDVSPTSGEFVRSFVLPISYNGKDVTVKLTTDQVTTPGIQALINSPEEQANTIYETGRQAGVTKHTIPGHDNVTINYGDTNDNTDDEVIINDKSYSAEQGLYLISNMIETGNY